MKFEEWQGADLKRGWKIVRRDNCTDVAGEIITADEDTGECSLQVTAANGVSEKKSMSFGVGGIKIVSRR
jgi:hypothetical protein